MLEHDLPGRPIDRQVLAMIGECHILVAAGDRRPDHLLEGGAAITRSIGVIVEVTSDLGQIDEFGQRAVCRGFYFAGSLPHGWRDQLHLESLVDVILGLGSDQLPILEEPVLAEQPPPIDGSLTQSDVVRLGTGEIEKSRAQLTGLHSADIDLHSFPGQKRGLGAAGPDHLGSLGQADDELGDGCWVGSGDNDVDIPDGV